MMRFTLQSGRKVELGSFHIIRTQFEFMATNQSEHQADVLPGIVRQFYPEAEVPFVIIRPANDSVPQATCIASFTSGPLDLPEDEGYSYLVACWFVHHVERSVANIICEGLSQLDWEANARDYSWW